MEAYDSAEELSDVELSGRDSEAGLVSLRIPLYQMKDL